MGDDVNALGWDNFRTALGAAGATWTEVDLDYDPFPGATTLHQYNVLIWFDSGTLSPGDNEAQIVSDWLQLGSRNLFVSGRDFIWDLANGTPGAGEHNLYTRFGIVYYGSSSDTAIATLDGQSADPITADFVAPSGLQLTQTYSSSGDYADPNQGIATYAALYGAGGMGSGYAGMSHYDSGAYKTVWLGINFYDGLVNPSQRNQLITNVLNFFKN